MIALLWISSYFWRIYNLNFWIKFTRTVGIYDSFHYYLSSSRFLEFLYTKLDTSIFFNEKEDIFSESYKVYEIYIT